MSDELFAAVDNNDMELLTNNPKLDGIIQNLVSQISSLRTDMIEAKSRIETLESHILSLGKLSSLGIPSNDATKS